MSNRSVSRIVGRHVYGDLYGCPKDVLSDEELLKNAVIEAVKLSNTTLLELKSWRVSGEKGGVSILALVIESHIAVHTWPNYGYATVDVYTCGEKSDPWKAFDYLVKILKPKHYIVHYSDRSQLPIAYD